MINFVDLSVYHQEGTFTLGLEILINGKLPTDLLICRKKSDHRAASSFCLSIDTMIQLQQTNMLFQYQEVM